MSEQHHDEDTPEHKAAWQEWCELIAETNRLTVALGVRPWEFKPWSRMRNKHPAGSPEHEAFEAVRARGIEIDARRAEVGEILEREQKAKQERSVAWLRDELSAVRQGRN